MKEGASSATAFPACAQPRLQSFGGTAPAPVQCEWGRLGSDLLTSRHVLTTLAPTMHPHRHLYVSHQQVDILEWATRSSNRYRSVVLLYCQRSQIRSEAPGEET